MIFVFITFRQRYSSLLLDFHEDLVQSLHKLVDLLFLDPDGRGRRQVRSGQRVAVGAPTCVVTRVCLIALSEKTQTTDLSANKYTSINTTQVKITVKKSYKKDLLTIELVPLHRLDRLPGQHPGPRDSPGKEHRTDLTHGGAVVVSGNRHALQAHG